jgi:excisionase family DNA binding protein
MRKRKVTPAPSSEAQLLIDVPEAARRMSVGGTTIYALIKKGELPVIKVESATRLEVAAIQKWIEEHRQVHGQPVPAPFTNVESKTETTPRARKQRTPRQQQVAQAS